MRAVFLHTARGYSGKLENLKETVRKNRRMPGPIRLRFRWHIRTKISCVSSAPALQSAAAGGASTIRSQLGQRIRVLREALSFTQEELAEKAGISVSFVSMIERGERTPYVETLVAISDALAITVSQLFLGLNAPRADIGQTQDLPLMAYLGTLRLDRKELDALLKVAKAMFDGKP